MALINKTVMNKAMVDDRSIEKYKNTKVLIVGFGRTCISAARFLSGIGCKINISDHRKVSELTGPLQSLKDMEINLEFGQHNEKTFLSNDWILVSPGVPMNIQPLVKARSKGIPILSDIELAYQITGLPIIAVTGTNGKTTTTTLLGEILQNAGKKVFIGGNIGVPVLDAFLQGHLYELLILEVSSFQLEGTTTFNPFIGIILNITPDHLDRYTDMEEYKLAKKRLLCNQTERDFALLNALDPWVSSLARGCKSDIYFFDTGGAVSKGAGINDSHVIIKDNAEQIDLGIYKQMGLKGNHNLENIMAASLAAYLIGTPKEIIAKTLREFRGLPHRLEMVRDIKGITFIDDSKGTNVGALIKAIESLDTPIILIAGGQAKGGDFSPLRELARQRIRGAFLIGEARSKIADILRDYTTVLESEDFRSAITDAYRFAKPGETVLLSPGCASFDMFEDYKDRGEQFKRIVMEL